VGKYDSKKTKFKCPNCGIKIAELYKYDLECPECIPKCPECRAKVYVFKKRKKIKYCSAHDDVYSRGSAKSFNTGGECYGGFRDGDAIH